VGAPTVDTRSVFINEQPSAIGTISDAAPIRTGTFDGSTSYDPDGSIVSYLWDFGDGTTATGAVVQHTYAIADTYYVSLTVQDDKGGQDGQGWTVTLSQDLLAGFENINCGCETMTVKFLGPVEGPAGFNHGPRSATGIADEFQNTNGPYYHQGRLAWRFEVIATLVKGSNPPLCSEGQKAKGTYTYTEGGVLKTKPHKGATTSHPSYDSGLGPDDPYTTGDNPAIVESTECSYTDANWCDDDYHGGGSVFGSGVGRDGGPPSMWKKYGGNIIWWLDGPGPRDVTGKLPVTFKAKFSAVVSGNLGTCACSYYTELAVDAAGNLTSDFGITFCSDPP
jgi:PKD repeat protein